MAKNEISDSENIFVQIDQGNLIHVDPSSVVDSEGVKPRSIKQEDMVMYVNLEADIIPRTNLINDNTTSTITSIAQGTLNFLRKSNGGDFDSTWTDSYFNEKIDSLEDGIFNRSDESGQSFGIDSIDITVKGANFIPRVVINFIDVRAKTLFESPKNSPYNAFFHLPWPIFYLTVKGYYGKAIKYRLHMVKFTSRFNDTNGNFEVSCEFVGSTYAHLSDIPLKAVINAPYMFLEESERDVKFNEITQQYEKKVSRTSRGYSILTSVYNEMKQKKLISPDFPVRTLKELGFISRQLDGILEKEIFDNLVDMNVLSTLKEIEKNLTELDLSIDGWKQKYLSNVDTIELNGDLLYRLNSIDKTNSSNIFDKNKKGTLEQLIEFRKNSLLKNVELLNLQNKNDKTGPKLKVNITLSELSSFNNYVTTINGEYFVKYGKLKNDINEIIKNFNQQKDKIIRIVEEEINRVVKSNNALGFEPTIRNVFAVILANAETFLRLMKDTHQNAFDVAEQRKNLINQYSDENRGEKIYPWPQIKKKSGKDNIIAYPAESDLIDKLQSDNGSLWPEVNFVEEFIRVTSGDTDNLSTDEPNIKDINYVFEDDVDVNNLSSISNLLTIDDNIPYIEKTITSVLYELWERISLMTFIGDYDNNAIRELTNIEFENLKNNIKYDKDIIDVIRNSFDDVNDFINKLKGISPFERYPYFIEQIPTTYYIKNVIENPFKIKKFNNISRDNNITLYQNLNKNLKNKKPEKKYPYSTNLYQQYLKKYELNSFNGIFTTKNKKDFITTPISPKTFSKTDNLFSKKIKFGDTEINVLNTPYFHNQLMSEFNNGKSYGKYVGSSYILLNSLMFNELHDTITFDGYGPIKMFDLFKNIESRHYLPYHLILKWGSIYHRYKEFVLNNNDILSGCLNNNNEIENIDYDFFINGGFPTNFNITDVGKYPFYQTVFSQIVNEYGIYNPEIGESSFDDNLLNGGIITKKHTSFDGEKEYWSLFVKNQIFDNNDKNYTILPSNGLNLNSNKKLNTQELINETLNDANEKNLRIILEDEYYVHSLFGGKLNTPYEYCGDSDNILTLNDNNKKVFDLISTFRPDILEKFEDLFLKFSSLDINENNYEFDTLYPTFQQLLKEIVKVEISNNDVDVFEYIKQTQKNKLNFITQNILSNDNIIELVIGNPNELNKYILFGFTQFNGTSPLNIKGYDILQETQQNLKYLDLYLGEDPNNSEVYLEFFRVNNVEISQENIFQFRPLVYLFAQYSLDNVTVTSQEFKNFLIQKYITNNSSIDRLFNSFNLILNRIKSDPDFKYEKKISEIKFARGYKLDNIKLETYNTFKVFNDKWIGGNSIGRNLLFEDFMFLDRANKDIGDKLFLNLDRISSVTNGKNDKISLYSALSVLIQGTNLDMRALPAYVNFYGNEYNSRTKITNTTRLANNLFGTFLDIDYQESRPKVIIQYVGPASEHLDMRTNKKYNYNDDSFNITNTNNNPILSTDIVNSDDLFKSNKVVSFNVNVGDQHQGMFKSFKLDQTSLKLTSESFVVIENLGRSESGAGTHNVDVGLWDLYKKHSYQCEIVSMGNVMIQPTMYFYLKNVPMFRGTYWITEVSHSIKNNNITTMFKGVRISQPQLPEPESNFATLYRYLFEKLLTKAITKTKTEDRLQTKTEEIINTDTNIPTIIDRGGEMLPNETIVKESGLSIYGLMFNGYKNERYVQKIKLNNKPLINGVNVNKEWYRAKVIVMGGETYQINDNTSMSLFNYETNVNLIPNKVSWGEIKNGSEYYYSTKFEMSPERYELITNATTEFYNPYNNKMFMLKHEYDFTPSNRKFSGPLTKGPTVEGFGIGLSRELMKKLGLQNGQIVYFNLF